MKKALSISSLLLFAIGSVVVAGCDDETHADPAIIKSMNDQRKAQEQGMKGGGAPGMPTGKPGAAPAPAGGQ